MKDIILGSFYNKELKEEIFNSLTARQWLKQGYTVIANVKEDEKWKKIGPLKTYKGPVLEEKSGKKYRVIGNCNPVIEIILLGFYNADKNKKSSWKKKVKKWIKNGEYVKVKAFHIEYKMSFIFGPVEELDLEKNIVKLTTGEKLHWTE